MPRLFEPLRYAIAEKLIARLIDQASIKTIREAVAFGGDYFDQKALSSAFDTFAQYAGYGGRNINGLLRIGKTNWSETGSGWIEYINQIKKTLSSCSNKNAFTGYRFMSRNDFVAVQGNDVLKTGAEFVDYGFTGVGLLLNELAKTHKNTLLMRICIPSKSQCAYIEPISHRIHEQEVLIQRKTRYCVNNIENHRFSDLTILDCSIRCHEPRQDIRLDIEEARTSIRNMREI